MYEHDYVCKYVYVCVGFYVDISRFWWYNYCKYCLIVKFRLLCL